MEFLGLSLSLSFSDLVLATARRLVEPDNIDFRRASKTLLQCK